VDMRNHLRRDAWKWGRFEFGERMDGSNKGKKAVTGRRTLKKRGPSRPKEGSKRRPKDYEKKKRATKSRSERRVGSYVGGFMVKRR